MITLVFPPDASRARSSSALQHSPLRRVLASSDTGCLRCRDQRERRGVLFQGGAGECGGWLESRSRQGGQGGAELAEDGSQRVHGARTDPLSLPRTHVSLTQPAFLLSVLSGNVLRCNQANEEADDSYLIQSWRSGEQLQLLLCCSM